MSRRNFRRNNQLQPRKTNFQRGLKTFTDVAKASSIALGTAKLAMSLINPEFKFLDVSPASFTFGSTPPGIHLLNGAMLGTSSTNRIGRSTKMKSIQIDMVLNRNPAALAGVADHCKVMLVLDKDPSQTQFGIGQLWADSTQPVISPRNLDYRKRFVILKDWNISFNSIGNNASRSISYYKQIDMHTIFDGSNLGDITDIINNALYLVFTSTAPTNQPLADFYSRIRFLDN